MTSQPPPPDAPPDAPPGHAAGGFVVAMRARLTLLSHVQFEWILLSRWGLNGRFLSIARTFRAAPPRIAVPIDLAPQWSMVGCHLPLPPARHSSFLLRRELPARVVVAGQFTPADGYVRLSGDRGSLRLVAEGCFADEARSPAWCMQAVQRPWMGEFQEDAERAPSELN